MPDPTVDDLQKQVTELKMRVDMLEKIVFQLAKEPKKDGRDWVKQI
ncbi:MAG: hypothetical protein NUK63_05445 [Candidatus Bathyarchaeum tardum]|nr:MAG: hypothetical protein NUK63_05445 [Candidatus Bathyarchaeum tardum]